MSSEHPLRPYYVAPAPTDSSFGLPKSPSSARASPPTPSASLRPPRPNRYEASISSSYDDPYTPTAGTMLRAFVTSSLLSFTSTALVMPFEVGKTLAQVQWVPKEGLDLVVYAGDETVVPEEVVEVSPAPLGSRFRWGLPRRREKGEQQHFSSRDRREGGGPRVALRPPWGLGVWMHAQGEGPSKPRKLPCRRQGPRADFWSYPPPARRRSRGRGLLFRFPGQGEPHFRPPPRLAAPPRLAVRLSRSLRSQRRSRRDKARMDHARRRTGRRVGDDEDPREVEGRGMVQLVERCVTRHSAPSGVRGTDASSRANVQDNSRLAASMRRADSSNPSSSRPSLSPSSPPRPSPSPPSLSSTPLDQHLSSSSRPYPTPSPPSSSPPSTSSEPVSSSKAPNPSTASTQARSTPSAPSSTKKAASGPPTSTPTSSSPPSSKASSAPSSTSPPPSSSLASST